MDQSENPQESKHSNPPTQSPTIVYEIRVLSQLDSSWSDWFSGLGVTPQGNGETLISGPVPDQAALQGILTSVFNLGLTLLSVRRIET